MMILQAQGSGEAYQLLERLLSLEPVKLFIIVLLAMVIVLGILAVVMIWIIRMFNKQRDDVSEEQERQAENSRALINVIADSNKIQSRRVDVIEELAHNIGTVASNQQAQISVHTVNTGKIDNNTTRIEQLAKQYTDYSTLLNDGMTAINQSLNDLTEAIDNLEVAKPADVQSMINVAIEPVFSSVTEVLRLIRKWPEPPPTVPTALPKHQSPTADDDDGPVLPKASGE